MARIEATISAKQAKRLRELAKQLDVSQSQVINDALALLFEVIRQSRMFDARPCVIDRDGNKTEFILPILSLVERSNRMGAKGQR